MSLFPTPTGGRHRPTPATIIDRAAVAVMWLHAATTTAYLAVEVLL